MQVFRPSEEAPAIAQDASRCYRRKLVCWLQLGIRSDEAARIAHAGGMRVVMDRCMGVVHGSSVWDTDCTSATNGTVAWTRRLA